MFLRLILSILCFATLSVHGAYAETKSVSHDTKIIIQRIIHPSLDGKYSIEIIKKAVLNKSDESLYVVKGRKFDIKELVIKIRKIDPEKPEDLTAGPLIRETLLYPIE